MANTKISHVQYVDPDTEWKLGFVGFWTRLRGLVTWTFGNFGIMIVSNLYRHWEITVIVGGWWASGVVVMRIVRSYRIQRTRSDQHFHDFCHRIRDDAAKVFGSGDANSGGAPALFDSFNRTTAQTIAEYYRVLMRDPSATCSIRLASIPDDGRKVYMTCGRSNGLDPIREENSRPIPADRGLPAKLRGANHQGVFIIPSIKAAIESRDYLHTPNDDLPDSQSLIICPINGWERGEKAMVGTLSVASKNLNAFSPWQTVPLKSFADLLGLVYPVFIARLMEKRTVPSASALTGPHFGKSSKRSRKP